MERTRTYEEGNALLQAVLSAPEEEERARLAGRVQVWMRLAAQDSHRLSLLGQLAEVVDQDVQVADVGPVAMVVGHRWAFTAPTGPDIREAVDHLEMAGDL